ncbi:hypothetical protein QNO09_12805 [Streptomyces sp. 378]|uniref:hypothetical protein n=1 Tax=Streptomyces sp. 378 TaxID=3049412 RepID=UPI0024C29081|nr:hypothetical protein [Streptomyces sp. 378]MDK1344166.1 hypothetical protein [Streptomyces sp. 378]
MTTPPQHPVWITDPEPIEGAPDDVSQVYVSLVPASDPHVIVRFQYVIHEGRKIEGPYAIHVQQAPDTPVEEWKPVGATLIRDLPLTKLERVARMMLTFGQRTPEGAPLDLSAGVFEPPPAVEEIPARAEKMVRSRHPDVDPDHGPGALRRWKRLTKLAEVQLEYNAAAARGEKAPATVVAEQRGVSPATVNTWLHHAKKEGLDAQLAPDISVVAVASE